MLTFAPTGPSLEARMLGDRCLSVCMSGVAMSYRYRDVSGAQWGVGGLWTVSDSEHASTLTKATPAGGRGLAMLARFLSPVSV